MKISEGYVPYLVLLAFGFWFVSFYLNPVNFWIEMSSAVVILAGLSLYKWESYNQLTTWNARSILIGTGSAIGLYWIFWIGNYVLTRLVPFSGNEIEAVYSNSVAAPIQVIGMLLVTVIGPGEEIFWRGTVQKKLTDRYGGLMGLVAGALLYSLVHVWALNITLLIAALVCGLVWGWIYYLEKNLAPLIISHSLWSLLIFVIFPV